MVKKQQLLKIFEKRKLNLQINNETGQFGVIIKRNSFEIVS